MAQKDKTPETVFVRAYKVARSLHNQMKCSTQMEIYSGFLQLECTFFTSIKAPQLAAILDYECDEILLFAKDNALVARLTYYTAD